MLRIWFLLQRISIELWKKVVFLSASITQEIVDFILQNSASRLAIVDCLAKRDFSKSIRKLLGLFLRVDWTPLSLAETLLFLWKILPKWYLFQVFALSVKDAIALEGSKGPNYAARTKPGREGWQSHIGWNLNGQGNWIPWSSLKDNTIGLWSEWDLSKCFKQASRYKTFQSTFTKTLSILSWIRWDNVCRFIHV